MATIDELYEQLQETKKTVEQTFAITVLLKQTLDRFMPLLERYEQASKANSILGARRAMKGAART